MIKETSVKTYQELRESGQLSKQQKLVLQAFINMDYVCTRNEVKQEQLSSWEKSTISGCVNELLDKGFLQSVGKRPDNFSGKTAEILMVTEPEESEEVSESVTDKSRDELEAGDVLLG